MRKKELYFKLREVEDLLESAKRLRDLILNMIPMSGMEYTGPNLQKFLMEKWGLDSVEVDQDSMDSFQINEKDICKVKVKMGVGNVYTHMRITISKPFRDNHSYIYYHIDFDTEACGPTIHLKGPYLADIIEKLVRLKHEPENIIDELK